MSLPLLVAAMPAPARGQDAPLDDALRAQRAVVRLDAGQLMGAGGELLVREGRASSFVLIGEEHGVAQTPALVAALFEALAPAGYEALAIETGDGVAAALTSLAGEPDPMAALTRFYRDHWPGVPFYTLAPEAELLVAVARAGGAIWGLDYDILADRHAFDRLAELADRPEERVAAVRAKAVADSLLDLALSERNPGRVMMFGGPPSLLAKLRAVFDPEPGSEEDRILTLLEETLAINRFWQEGDAWGSNQRRAQWNKRQLGRLWFDAWERTGPPPRVMLKFGASHMVRGRSFTGVFDLGSLAADLAEATGGRSFHLMVVGGTGSEHAVMDPTVLEYRAAPAEIQTAEWAASFFRNALPDGWTLYDLRPLRPRAAAGELGELPARLETVLFGYDALLVLTGSTPSTMLDIAP